MVRETRTMADDRFSQSTPPKFLFQIFVENLLDTNLAYEPSTHCQLTAMLWCVSHALQIADDCSNRSAPPNSCFKFFIEDLQHTNPRVKHKSWHTNLPAMVRVSRTIADDCSNPSAPPNFCFKFFIEDLQDTNPA
jgi:hypothetical protein